MCLCVQTHLFHSDVQPQRDVSPGQLRFTFTILTLKYSPLDYYYSWTSLKSGVLGFDVKTVLFKKSTWMNVVCLMGIK